MSGNENKLLPVKNSRIKPWYNRLLLPTDVPSKKQRIDHGIACYENIFRRNPFFPQIFCRPFLWSEAPSTEGIYKTAVHFLRPRRIQIVCSQSSLHMSYRYARIKCSQSTGKTCGRVPLYQNDVWCEFR